MAGAPPAIMLVAGEASGDLHGASLCRALRGLEPSCRLFGMGGARMAAAGMDLMEDVTATAVVGHSEAVGQVPRLYRAYRKLRAALSGPERPGVLVLIDFPEFNLRLARAARRAGVPVVYFIPPQIWAWAPRAGDPAVRLARPGRVSIRATPVSSGRSPGGVRRAPVVRSNRGRAHA